MFNRKVFPCYFTASLQMVSSLIVKVIFASSYNKKNSFIGTAVKQVLQAQGYWGVTP